MEELKKEFMYSVKEASEVTGINYKKIQRRAKRTNAEKIGKNYVVSGEWLIKEFELVGDISPKSEDKVSLERPEVSLRRTQSDSRIIRELEHRIQELEQELLIYNVSPNERLEVFTNEEYDIFRSRLIEWTTQQEQLIKATESFDKEKASLQELITHYRTQADYQREQANKILDIHQKLVDNIQLKEKNLTQRQIIEAREKGIIDDDWNVNE